MKVALIGAGRIGQVHAQYIREQPGIEQLVVCDREAGVAARVGARFGAQATFDDVAAMLEAVHPDVVHVCTPPALHVAPALLALEAGAHVLVEKPMTLDVADLPRLEAAVVRRPGALCVDHNFLFEPEMIMARRWLQEGQIGAVCGADMFYGADTAVGIAEPGAWSRQLPGGRFTDLLPHAIYLLMHVLGEVRGVEARSSAAGGGPTDAATDLCAVLDCERGVGSIRVSLVAIPWELALTIRGTEGMIRVDFAKQTALLLRPRLHFGRRLAQVVLGLDVGLQAIRGSVGRFWGKANGRLRGYPGMRTLIGHFYRSVREGLAPPVSYAEGAATVAASQRIREALQAARTSQRERASGEPRRLTA